MTFFGAATGADFSLPAPVLPRAGPAFCLAAAAGRFGVVVFRDCRFFEPASFAMGLALHVGVSNRSGTSPMPATNAAGA